MPVRLSAGEWHTVNTGLTEDETLWHFRSGWNVAALNCNGEQYAPITQSYGAFLERFSKELTSANRELDRSFRQQADTQRDAIRAREARMTQVYNYFAMPGARRVFCDTALQVANESLLTPPADPKVFAQSSLARYESAFRQFFGEYAEYETLSGEWDRKYGAQYGASQPGYVAIYGPGRNGAGVAASLLEGGPEPVGAVFDPATGVMVPVINVPQDSVSQPVVQPVAEAGSEAQEE